MCGILCKTNYYSETDCLSFIAALKKMEHRGPDERGLLINNNVALGHNRLSIIDIENGHQPMTEFDNHLIYNGEIYNQKELSSYLNKKYTSDTALLFDLLKKDNENCIDKINGIFAFVYVTKDKIIAARDPVGVKPLYYTFYNNDIILSSEIKGILEITKKAIVDTEGLQELLAIAPAHTPGKTVYKGIYEVKPGHYITFSKEDGFKDYEYFKLKPEEYNLSLDESIIKVKDMLTDIINNQMVSDVGISSFLSGGLDSSIIVSVMKQKIKDLDTYSISYKSDIGNYKPNSFETSNDQDYIKYITGINHTNCVIDNDTLLFGLHEALYYRDSPGMTTIDSSLLFLSECIAKKHKVSVSGECADEIFGGYPWFYRKELFQESFPWIRNISFRENLLKPCYKAKLKLKDYLDKSYNNLKKEAPLLENDSPELISDRQMYYLNLKHFMPTLLMRKDSMTMGNSLEVRVPFADKNLVKYLYNVPFKYKYYDSTEKKLLREAFKDILPKEIETRKKSPYPRNQSKVFLEDSKKLLKNTLENKKSILYELFDTDKLYELIDSEEELEVPWFGQLMKKAELFCFLYQMYLWFRLYNVKLEMGDNVGD